jgi:hypothetical protein
VTSLYLPLQNLSKQIAALAASDSADFNVVLGDLIKLLQAASAIEGELAIQQASVTTLSAQVESISAQMAPLTKLPSALATLTAAVATLATNLASLAAAQSSGLTNELVLLSKILTQVTPLPAISVEIEFSSQSEGESNMPLSMPANHTGEKYFIIGKDATGLLGAQLATGQTINVISSDPNTVVIAPDATPGVDNENTQSVASGGVTVGPTPALNTAVTVTATVLNADGSTAETASDTVTITAAVPGVATSVGVLFEQPVSGAPAS